MGGGGGGGGEGGRMRLQCTAVGTMKHLGIQRYRYNVASTALMTLFSAVSASPSARCENVDSVIGFITIKGQRERLDNFCGSQLPNQIMSNEHRMTVIFQSFGSRPPSVKGFRAIYQFVTSELTASTYISGLRQLTA
ncbi:hypothetical protein HPB48_020796 [Haemaphysalis longicornis]|uniref:CUB domain-containing protein n=1 Tax=Haemaphysalis longicornis TaxID=44386 RepID=A0A9J6H1E3_HAELO|nr:hypothetical protein HPB48_020796 [Haemaphysalis longicornis]